MTELPSQCSRLEKKLAPAKLIKFLKQDISLSAIAKSFYQKTLIVWTAHTPNPIDSSVFSARGLGGFWVPYVVYHHLNQRHVSNGVCVRMCVALGCSAVDVILQGYDGDAEQVVF